MDTRRRAASDLVRGLCKFHEQRVIEIFSGHVVSMLQVTKNMLWFLKTTEELETERKMGKVCLSHSCSHHSSFFVFLYLSILSTQYSEYTVLSQNHYQICIPWGLQIIDAFKCFLVHTFAVNVTCLKLLQVTDQS